MEINLVINLLIYINILLLYYILIFIINLIIKLRERVDQNSPIFHFSSLCQSCLITDIILHFHYIYISEFNV